MSTSTAAKRIRYTWDDYRSWPDDERWQIIGGDAFEMSAAPTTNHQKLSIRLAAALETFLQGKPCDVFAAPVDLSNSTRCSTCRSRRKSAST